jgi:hypothetical protein
MVNPEQIFPQKSSQESEAVCEKENTAAARFSPPTQIQPQDGQQRFIMGNTAPSGKWIKH